MTRIAAVQSNYIPWKGYFDLINSVDEFVLLDEVQYTRRDWRNRNRIKTPEGTRWLTVPVRNKGLYTQRIDAAWIADARWARSHLSTLEHYYRHSPHYEYVAELLKPVYAEFGSDLLSDVNHRLLSHLCECLAITTPITRSTDYTCSPERSRRLLDICRETHATEYVSGPTARGYLDVDMFAREGIAVSWFDYSGYEEYRQPYGAFVHGVSIVDLLFSEGPNSRSWLKSTVASACV